MTDKHFNSIQNHFFTFLHSENHVISKIYTSCFLPYYNNFMKHSLKDQNFPKVTNYQLIVSDIRSVIVNVVMQDVRSLTPPKVNCPANCYNCYCGVLHYTTLHYTIHIYKNHNISIQAENLSNTKRLTIGSMKFLNFCRL